jgi:tetratricopeptide (TPR) repeat protein
MKYLLLASTLLVTACGGISLPEIKPYTTETASVTPFAAAYDNGKKHLCADRAGLAIVAFEKALAIDPTSVAALNAIAMAYDQLHRPDVAKVYYLKALAIEPNSADTLNNMAVSTANSGDVKTASEFFTRAAELAPNDGTIHENMQLAGLASPAGPSPPDSGIMPEVIAAIDENRPQIERTGLDEYTLTLPPTTIQVMPLAPIAVSTLPKPSWMMETKLDGFVRHERA